MLAFLGVVVLLLFIAPLSLFLIGYVSQRYLGAGSRRIGRASVVRETNQVGAGEKLKA